MPDQKPSAIVMVPLYTSHLSTDAALSLARSVRVLGHHPFAIVCPLGLDLSPLDSLLAPAKPRLERFDASYFDGIAGYNRLMLSKALYERFADYDYLLVCQTDAYVFHDALDHWCVKAYDYIGAPWIATNRTWLNGTLFDLNNLFRKRKKSDEYFFKVGNGGFSLRRLAMMRRIVSELRDDIDWHAANPDYRDRHIEDRYMSIVAPAHIPEMRIPDYREAVAFCIDRRPRLAMRMNAGQLPFACHGFDKHHVRAFWQPILSGIEQSSSQYT